jgi:hypothetical protein
MTGFLAGKPHKVIFWKGHGRKRLSRRSAKNLRERAQEHVS